MSNVVRKPAAVATIEKKSPSLVARLAARYSVDADKMLQTLKGTVFKGQRQKDGTVVEATTEQLMALLVVADQYSLNPFTREIYAFPDKKNGIVPVVGVDGWLRIINQHPKFEGMEITDSNEMVISEGGEHPPAPAWIEVKIYREDRKIPTTVREYFVECYRPPFEGESKNGGKYKLPGPWQSHPARFLRHKAIIQAARIAFGFVGIYDPDEAERIRDAVDVTVGPAPAGKPLTAPPKSKKQAAALPTSKPAAPSEELPFAETGEVIAPEDVQLLLERLTENGLDAGPLLEAVGAESLELIAKDKLRDAHAWIDHAD